MAQDAVHNPDQYMAEFRQLLSQGNKRIALLLGAGVPASIVVDEGGTKHPLIPMIRDLTTEVLSKLPKEDAELVSSLTKDLGENANIEQMLSKLRLLTRALGTEKILNKAGSDFDQLAKRICALIGERVKVPLPAGENPYTHLVGWISGTARRYAVEVFTPNYDLLLEEALERAHVSYFDGFSGSVLPFFDAATVSNDELPARWTRVWKLHGSLGWALTNGEVVRTQSRSATELIYPDHLKYDQTQKQPYAALLDRLKAFLRTPDTLLVTCGFSFADAHIVSALEEALAANPLTAVVALQFRNMADEKLAAALAQKRSNLSVYAADSAIINSVSGPWRVGPAPSDQWVQVRKTFWGPREEGKPDIFKLGCFREFARFLALASSDTLTTVPPNITALVQAAAAVTQAAAATEADAKKNSKS